MTGLDIPFPFSEYQILNSLPSFNLIYPYDHPLSQIININMMLRVVAFEDEDYASFMANELKPQEITPVGGKLLEIGYIRETSLRDVAKFEWKYNYGPENQKEYLKLTKLETADTFVKVISLRTPDYSLTTFNKRYGTSVRQK